MPFRLGPTQTIEAGDLHLRGLDAQIIDDRAWRLLMIRDIATDHEVRELASVLAGALKWVAIEMGGVSRSGKRSRSSSAHRSWWTSTDHFPKPPPLLDGPTLGWVATCGENNRGL